MVNWMKVAIKQWPGKHTSENQTICQSLRTEDLVVSYRCAVRAQVQAVSLGRIDNHNCHCLITGY